MRRPTLAGRLAAGPLACLALVTAAAVAIAAIGAGSVVGEAWAMRRHER